MTTHEIAFARGTCHIQVEERAEMPPFTARVSVVGSDGTRVHPLVFGDGRRLEIHATSLPLVLGSTITYLEGRFGAPSELQHGFANTVEPRPEGEPISVEGPGANAGGVAYTPGVSAPE